MEHDLGIVRFRSSDQENADPSARRWSSYRPRIPTLIGRMADAERETRPAIARPALAGSGASWVIFEAIERIREEDDTVLLMEQHALAAFEIADYLYVPEFGKLNMLGDAPKLLDEYFRHRSRPGRPFGESDRL